MCAFEHQLINACSNQYVISKTPNETSNKSKDEAVLMILKGKKVYNTPHVLAHPMPADYFARLEETRRETSSAFLRLVAAVCTKQSPGSSCRATTARVPAVQRGVTRCVA